MAKWNMPDEADEIARLRKALMLALPVMRRNAYGHLDCVSVKGVLTIEPIEFEEIAPDIAAIRAASAIVGSVPDLDGVDTDWLNMVLEHDPALGSAS